MGGSHFYGRIPLFQDGPGFVEVGPGFVKVGPTFMGPGFMGPGPRDRVPLIQLASIQSNTGE